MKNKLIALLFLSFLSINLSHAQNEYLMIVDVQKQFYENTKIESRANEIVENINKIIGNFEAQNVIYIKTTGKMLSISFKGIKTEPITPNPQLDSRLDVVNEIVFIKNTGNAFSNADLMEFLQKNHTKNITIVGLLAEQCISKTALGGIEKGFQITVVPEAVLGKTKAKKEKAIKKMAKRGVQVKTLKEFLYIDDPKYQ